MSDIDLSGKVAIVTGAGGGMGGAMTLSLAAAGAQVAAMDVNEDAVRTVAAAAEKAGGGRVLPLVASVAAPDDCARAVERTIAEFGGLHVLVNNAGVGMQSIRANYGVEPVRFWEADIERWQAMMNINFRGPFVMARLAAPHMIAHGWGRIVNVTTSLDTMLRGAYAPYGSSKAGLEAATACWAKDLADTGVTVNVLVPGGPTNTGFIPASSPFDRDALIQPDIMAAPIRWLASNASDGITDCRFVAVDFDPGLAPAEAAENARSPAAWPGMGTQARWPGAS